MVVEALILKVLMLGITAACKVSDEVEDFVFCHSIEQASWHGGGLRNNQFFNRIAIDGSAFVRIGQISIQR